MDFSILAEPRLLFVIAISAAVALLGTISVAARPAAVITGRVQLSLSVSQIFFMITRFANIFYLPLMASFVDQAVHRGKTDQLQAQIMWVILGSAAGALASWICLGNFVSLYRYGVEQIQAAGSTVRVMTRHLRPSRWSQPFKAFFAPTHLGVRLFRLEGVEPGFLLFNVVATSIWTVGALSALFVSAQYPQYKSTAVLLSGLVNAFAAISFSVWVDPKAALITDKVIKGQRPENQVNVTAVHLAMGNFVGSLLGLAMFFPGTRLIAFAAQGLGSQGQGLVGSLWVLVVLNIVVTLLSSTTYASRVSAVVTGHVATALSIYNLFFLVTRLAQQIYAPVLGSVSDHLVSDGPGHLGELEGIFRTILGGAGVGALLGLLLLPTFVQIYNQAVYQLDRRGSIPSVMLACLSPRAWPTIWACLRRPGLLGVTLADFRSIPKGFLFGNVLVISIYTVGVMAAIFAGAELGDKAARTANLLSSVVNGLATITLSVIVDPTISLIADQAVKKERSQKDVFTMAVGLMFGMLLGVLLSQAVFTPAVAVISFFATLLASN